MSKRSGLFFNLAALSLVAGSFIFSANCPAVQAASVVKGMHRLDFHLAHASCPTCILKVRKALRETPGIVKCEIALRKPYGGVLIYEPGKVALEKIKEIAAQADPNKVVEMADLIEKPIDSVPALLVPTYMFESTAKQAQN